MSDAAKILIVEDDTVVGELFTLLLRDTPGREAVVVETAEEAVAKLPEGFDLVITDKNLPGMSGLELLQKIKAVDPNLDVILMTAYADMKSMLAAMHDGVYDYLVKPFDSLDEVLSKIERALEKRRMRLENIRLIEHLTTANAQIEEMNRSLEQKVKERTQQLSEANERLQALTLTDDVTGLYNQRFLYKRLEEEFARERRYHEGLAVIMVDLDDFKRVNDSHDHLFGSRVLRRVGDVLRGAVRNTDFVIRYGGDEFVVILPHTTLRQATAVAQRIRTRLQETDVGDRADQATSIRPGEHEYDEPFFCTASLGVACLGECAADSPRSLLRAADRALYEAKANGRNRVGVMLGDEPVTQAAG